MTEAAFNNVIRLVVATTSQELLAVLGYLPHGVRFGVAQQLDEVGEAYRYELHRNCAYYLRRQRQGILVWRWSYIACLLEANRLQALIASLDGPLDADSASRLFERATGRSVNNPRPMGLALGSQGEWQRVAGRLYAEQRAKTRPQIGELHP